MACFRRPFLPPTADILLSEVPNSCRHAFWCRIPGLLYCSSPTLGLSSPLPPAPGGITACSPCLRPAATTANMNVKNRQCERQHRPDAAQEILESLASEGVEPDARCYRLAAEAFRKSGNEKSRVSPEVQRLLDIAERLESGQVAPAPTGGS